MAIVTTKSGPITNRDSLPQVKNNSTVEGGRMRTSAGTVETVSGDSIGSKYVMFSLPSNCRVDQVLLSSDDIGTTTITNIGLYRTTADGGAVVSAAFFASALSLNAGPLSAVDVTHQSGTFDISACEKPLWQALGLTSDPSVVYDVVCTLTAAADAAGTISLKGHYSI